MLTLEQRTIRKVSWRLLPLIIVIAVGAPWVLDGIASDLPTGSMGNPDDQPPSNAQLVQAMAGFGGSSGAAENLNTAPLSVDTSQQTFLTTPQHA